MSEAELEEYLIINKYFKEKQMELSEEEKKAIEYLKENSLVRIENEKIVAYGNSYKLVLLNLIEKQQKEIEDLQGYTKVIGRVGGKTSE